MAPFIRPLILLVLGGALLVHAEEPAGVYARLCASCHGANLEGGKGPSLLGDLKHGADAVALTQAIQAGFPLTGMPPAGAQLTDADLTTLVVYLRERRANRIIP